MRAIPTGIRSCVAASVLALAAAPVRGDGGYITTYSHHLEAGELEVMILTDYTSPSEPRQEEGQGEYVSQMLMVDYHVTDQFAVEPMIEWFQDVSTGEGKFTGYRLEARYKVFPKEVPLNPMLYAEYEDLDPETRFKMETSGWILPPYDKEPEEPRRERIMETRLVLSQDFGRWNAAVNWINESDLRGGETAFGYTLGVVYRIHPHGSTTHMAHGGHAGHDENNPECCPEETGKASKKAKEPFFRAGALALELYGALGDTRQFGLRPARQEHYLQPGIMFHLGKHGMLGLGFAFGLSDASDDLLRFSVGWEF